MTRYSLLQNNFCAVILYTFIALRNYREAKGQKGSLHNNKTCHDSLEIGKRQAVVVEALRWPF